MTAIRRHHLSGAAQDGLPEGEDSEWTRAAEAERRLRPTLSEVVGAATGLYRQTHRIDDALAFAIDARARQSGHLVGEVCAQTADRGAPDERSAALSALTETVERCPRNAHGLARALLRRLHEQGVDVNWACSTGR